jgi:hypothetical protein
MGYMKIPNLYADKTILQLKEVWVMEKVHGTSAHLLWWDGQLMFYPGGEKLERFKGAFDGSQWHPEIDDLIARFREYDFGHGDFPVTVFGEAYGGKQQGMRKVYGDRLSFVAFEVQIGSMWLNVPQAARIVAKLGLDFVPFTKRTLSHNTKQVAQMLEQEAVRPSYQGGKMGVRDLQPREGVVLRPMQELFYWDHGNYKRVMAKHKNPDYREHLRVRKLEKAQYETLEKADEIAQEWVTNMRLNHVLDKLNNPTGMEACGYVGKGMVEDVFAECGKEIKDSKAARRAISKRAVNMYKERVTKLQGLPSQHE